MLISSYIKGVTLEIKLHDILIQYIDKLDSSRYTLPIVMKSMKDELKIATNKFDEFMNANLVNLNKSKFLFDIQWSDKKYIMTFKDFQYQFDELVLEEDNEYAIPIKDIKEFQKYEQKITHLSIASDTLPKNFLVSYVSQYDAFLGELVEHILLLKPELFNNSDKELKFKDLIEFNTIQEAREFILEKEINSLLRKSHSEQFEWMENKFDVKLTKGLNIWKSFIEITERRNLFVHNNGTVSNQYIKVCNEHIINLDNIEIGTVLKVNSLYLRKSYSVFYELGFKLVNVLWRKLFPNNLEDADNSLIELTVELLRHKRYELAKTLLDFACITLKKYHSDVTRRMIIINRAIAYKFSTDNSKCQEILSKDDWSATSLSFQLAIAVLNDNDNEVYKLMICIGNKSTEITEYEYAEWPLFEKYKYKTEFQDTFKKIFNKELELIEIID